MNDKLKKQEYDKARYAANPEPAKARAHARHLKSPKGHRFAVQAWRDANPEKRRAYERALYHANPEAVKARILRRKYHISLDEYQRMLTAQGGVCMICRTDSPGKMRQYFCVDHHHGTQKVRGLLCGACNVAIGLLKDDSKLLRQAAEYLERT